MDNLLANQSGALLIASAPRRSLNPGSLVSPAKRSASSSYLFSRNASRWVDSGLTATRIGAPNRSAKNIPGRQKS
jgi:hypothetical protein